MRRFNIADDFAQLVAEYVASFPEMYTTQVPFELVEVKWDEELSDLDELDFLLGFEVVVPESDETEVVIGYCEIDVDLNLFIDFLED